jgi:hypothetical protein
MKIRALPVAVIVLLVSLSVRASAQILSRQPHLTAPPRVSPTATLQPSIHEPLPKPASPADKLDYFAGVWQETGEWKTSVLGPAGWFDTMDYNQWEKDRLSQRWARETGGGGGGTMTYRYDSKERVYTCHESDTSKSLDWEGTLKGDTWTWTGEAGRLEDGRTVRGRLTEKQLSPTSYSIEYEISIKGGKWTKVMTGAGYWKAKY